MAPVKLPFLPAVELGDLTVIPLVVGYCICSSLLSVVNKLAISVFPFPSLLTALQYAVSAASVWILGKAGVLQHDPLVWKMVLAYAPAAVVFYLAIFTNANVLKYANLDTFIVFRSSTPIMVAVADTLFRDQPWPSLATFGSLFVILLGAIGYVMTDYAFSITAYAWAFSYLAVITFEMVYVKHIVHSLGLNTWGFVYYNNLMSLAMAPLFWLVSGEFFETIGSDVSDWLQFRTFFPVAISCVFGLAISFFGFATRRAISATSFTVLGVTNKLLTVAINVTIWDKHASPFGVVCLLVTIIGGVLYQQTVSGGPKPSPKDVQVEEEKTTLLPDAGGNEKLERSLSPKLPEAGDLAESEAVERLEEGKGGNVTQ